MMSYDSSLVFFNSTSNTGARNEVTQTTTFNSDTGSYLSRIGHTKCLLPHPGTDLLGKLAYQYYSTFIEGLTTHEPTAK